jgi:c-di-GMP-binding flagellar brake protein YcgR
VRCTIPIRDEENGTFTTAVGSLFNVSGGGLSITDDKKLVPTDIGQVFDACQIDIPGNPIVITLQLMNSVDLTLSNGKQVRRLGFMFVDPPNTTQTAIQRYITKIEREQNSRATGMA